jgi:branched-subunit amino acid transport protein
MIWAAIIISGFATFLIRFSAIFQVKNSDVPEWLENIFRYVPTSVFAALIFPEILFNDADAIQFLGNPKILAAFAALLVTVITRNIAITITTGMVVLWIITL